MSRTNGHMVLGFLKHETGHPILAMSSIAAAETWVKNSMTLPVGTVVKFKVRGIAGTTAYTKPSQA